MHEQGFPIFFSFFLGGGEISPLPKFYSDLGYIFERSPPPTAHFPVRSVGPQLVFSPSVQVARGQLPGLTPGRSPWSLKICVGGDIEPCCVQIFPSLVLEDKNQPTNLSWRIFPEHS